MQGIPHFQYKYLLQVLQKLQETQLHDPSGTYAEMVHAEQQKLIEIYSKYKQTLDEVSDLVKQFDERKLATRRLIAYQKQQNRNLMKK